MNFYDVVGHACNHGKNLGPVFYVLVEISKKSYIDIIFVKFVFEGAFRTIGINQRISCRIYIDELPVFAADFLYAYIIVFCTS